MQLFNDNWQFPSIRSIAARGLVALGLGAVLVANVHAKNVLILSTGSVDAPAYVDAADVLNNIKKEFSAVAGNTVTTIDTMQLSNAITASTFGPGTYDLVAVVRFNTAYDAGNIAVLDDAIKNRWASGFALFYDTGGSSTSSAAADLQSMLSNAAGINFTASGAQPLDANFELNTNSAYAGSFGGLNPMRGGWFFYMNNVPAANALYLAPGATLPAAGATGNISSVYSVFVPATQSFGGEGACLIATADSSMFETRNYSDRTVLNGGNWNGTSDADAVYNKGKIAPAFLNALAPGGACGIPASITKAFAPKLVAPGVSSILTIKMDNAGANAVSGLNMTDNLPAPLVIAGPVQQNTCVGGTLSAPINGAVLSLKGATLPVGGCAISVPVVWPVADTAACVAPNNTRTNTIQPGTDFTTSQGQVATPATDTLTCSVANTPSGGQSATAVPTLAQWALTLMSVLMAGCAALVFRRRQAAGRALR